MTYKTLLRMSISAFVAIALLCTDTAFAGKLRDLGSSSSSSNSSRSSSSNSSRPSPSTNRRSQPRSSTPYESPRSNSPSQSNRSGGKLRDFGKAARGDDSQRPPPPPPKNDQPTRGGGSGNNSRGGRYPHHHHRRPYYGINSRFYCRRTSLFEALYFDDYYFSRCRPSRAIIVQRQRSEEAAGDQAPQEPAPGTANTSSSANASTNTSALNNDDQEQQQLPLESLRSSRMLEPSLRLDWSLGEFDSNTSFDDLKFEIGFRSVSVTYQRTDIVESYVENSQRIDDEINIKKITVNFRYRIQDQFAIEVGLGKHDFNLINQIIDTSPSAACRPDPSTGASLCDIKESTNIIKATGKWHLPRGFGIEHSFSTTLGGVLSSSEDELNLFYGYNNFSARLGYRIIDINFDDEASLKLNGLFFGVSAHF